MKNTILTLLIFLSISCSDDADPKLCKLEKIIAGENETIYSYNSDGMIVKQVNSTNEVINYDYTYSYLSNGKVEKVDQGDFYTEYDYYEDGKLSAITTYTQDGLLDRQSNYHWTSDKVEVVFTKNGFPNPYQITEFEFENSNIIAKTIKSFTGLEPNVITSLSEFEYKDFDSALSAFYIASLARPGYSIEFSKNNPSQEIQHTIIYQDGSIIQDYTFSIINSYTYNNSNATVTHNSISSNLTEIKREMIYSDCM